MKKTIEAKVEEYAEIRKVANTKTTKEDIDKQVRAYLGRRCSDVSEWVESHNYYKSLYKNTTLK